MASFQDLRTSILVHITDVKAAKSIIDSGLMKRSSKGMLGPGVYFAENREAAYKKSHNKGAIVISAVNLGKLYEVYTPEKQLTLQQLRAQNFDSVRGYKSKSPECKNFNTGTEFCVFEEGRITPLFAAIYAETPNYFYFKNATYTPSQFPIDKLIIVVDENQITVSDSQGHIFSTIPHRERLMHGRKLIFTNEGDFEFTKVIHRL